ncbi:MAG TPA: hypothetical protein V6C76_16240 [Drouetiella sp.]
MDLRIAHLYAHFLNIYGDRGNIITMVQRARWRGITATVQPIGLGEKIDPEYFDFYFIGGGQDKQQQTIAEDLVLRSDDMHKAVNSGSVILSICGGYQLLGHYYQPHEGPQLKGISLLDAHTVAGNRRMIGNVVVKRDDGSTLVGFENHSGKTFLGAELKALGKATTGNGNNGDDLMEGAVNGTVYGTYLHGSILPKNPHFADELLLKSLKRRHGDVKLEPLKDEHEVAAHKRALALQA